MNPTTEHHLSGQKPSDSLDLMPDASGLARGTAKPNGPEQTNVSQISDPFYKKKNPPASVTHAIKQVLMFKAACEIPLNT